MLTARVLTCSCRNRSVLHPPAKMNMVKRIMGRPRQEECSPQDNALGLMHLRRLFSELCHPPRHMTQKEQEEKLYMMLPVFNRVSPAGRARAFQDCWCCRNLKVGRKSRIDDSMRLLSLNWETEQTAGLRPKEWPPQLQSFGFALHSVVRETEAGRVHCADLVLLSPEVEMGGTRSVSEGERLSVVIVLFSV